MAIDNMKRPVSAINRERRAREEARTPEGDSTGAMAMESVAELAELMVSMNLEQMEVNAKLMEMIIASGMDITKLGGF